jgi:hypothetical protein
VIHPQVPSVTASMSTYLTRDHSRDKRQSSVHMLPVSIKFACERAWQAARWRNASHAAFGSVFRSFK